MKRTKEIVEVWNICECGQVLYDLTEATRGVCSRCWIKSLQPETLAALDTLLGMAFNKTTGEPLNKAIDSAFETLAIENKRKASNVL